MKQKFIIKENNPKLLVFFAGWACDETPFKQYRPKGSDYMICYDYRNLDFDDSVFDQYEWVNVVAWSMGVWAASYILNHSKKYQGISIAFNGTNTPISNTEGIPTPVFESTLQNLTPASLQKFMRRICGTAEAYKEFMAITPHRNFEEVKEELQCIKKHYCSESGLVWDENGKIDDDLYDSDEYEDKMNEYYDNYRWDFNYTYIGEEDAIFPCDNMDLAFQDARVLWLKGVHHYDAKMFQFLLEDMWSMPIDEFVKNWWYDDRRD